MISLIDFDLIPIHAKLRRWIIFVLMLVGIKCNAEKLYFDFLHEDFALNINEGLTEISVPEGYRYDDNDSGWLLPRKDISIICPYNYDLNNLSVKVDVEKVSTDCTLKKSDLIIDEIPLKVSDSSAMDIETSVRPFELIDGIHGDSGVGKKLAVIRPFLYDANLKELYFVKSIEVEFDWTYSDRWPVRSIRNLSDESDRFGVTYYCIENLQTYPTDGLMKNTKGASGVYEPPIEYLIITNRDLKPYFEPLAKWRTTMGVPTEVVALEDQKITPDLADSPRALKNYIFARYNAGVKYVCLGGDTSIVPTRYCKVAINLSSINTDSIPCDAYYASFDNDFHWDANGNGVFGEVKDDIDLIPDLVISRVPSRVPMDIENYINKLIDYELNYSGYTSNMKFLLGGMAINPQDRKENLSYSHLRGIQFADNELSYIWSNPIELLYDTGSTVGLDGFTIKNLEFALSDNYSYVLIESHGKEDAIQTQDGSFDKFNISRNQSDIPFHGFFTCCHIANFDYENCVVNSFLTSPQGGAISIIGNSVYGSSSGPSGISFESVSDICKKTITTTDAIESVSCAEGLKLHKSNLVVSGANGRLNAYSLCSSGDALAKTFVTVPNRIKASLSVVSNRATISIYDDFKETYKIIHSHNNGNRISVRRYYNFSNLSLTIEKGDVISICSKSTLPLIYTF